MTRQEIIAAALLDSKDYKRGAESYENPFSINRWVDRGVSDLCRITENAYLTYKIDITAGQASFCSALDLFYIESVTLTKADGTLVALPLTNAFDANEYQPAHQAYTVIPGTPNSLVFLGAGNYLLYPTPNYTALNGLVFRGFGILNNSKWANDEDECPLPLRTHETIVSYVAWHVAEHNNDLVTAQQRQRDYERGKGLFESEMRSLTDRHRHAFPIQQSYGYGFGDNISNL